MALFITAGSLYFYLNNTPDTKLSNDSKPEASEVQNSGNPRKGSENTGNKGNNSAIRDGFAGMESNNLAKSDDNTHMSNRSEKKKSGSYTETLSLLIQNDKPAEIVYFSRVEFDDMSDPIMMPAQQDEIPRYKNPATASWEMFDYSADADTYEKSATNELSLTAQISPTYSYRDIGTFGSGNVEQFNQYESGKISYSGGLQLGIKASGRLSIHAGLMYAQLGYDVKQVESFQVSKQDVGTDVLNGVDEVSTYYAANNSIGTINSDPETASFIAGNGVRNDKNEYFEYVPISGPSSWETETVGNIEQNFRYLEVPFLLRYRLFDHKFGVNLLGGISTNFLLGNNSTLNSDNKRSDLGPVANIKNINYMGNMGLGFDYSLGKNILLTMEPQFKYFLNSINESNLISNRPYMLGMFTGVRFMW